MKSGRMSSVVMWLLAVAVIVALGLTLAGYSKYKDLDSRLEEVNLQLTRSQDENGEIKTELAKLRSEYGEISKTAEAVESLLSTSNKEFSNSLKAGLRRNEQLIKEKEDTLSSMQTALEEFQQNISGLEEKNLGMIQSLTDDSANLKEELQQKTKELNNLSASLDNLRTLHAKLKSNLEQVNANLKPEKELSKKQEEDHIRIVELQGTLKKRSDSFQREMTRMEGYIKEIRLELTRLASLKRNN